MKEKTFKYKFDGQYVSNIEVLKDAYAFAETIKDEATRKAYLKSIENEFATHQMNQSNKKILPITIIGVIFILILIFISIKFPSTIQEYFGIYKTILAISCAGLAAILPGFININYKGFLRAGGALGVFTFIFLFVKPNENTFNVRVIVQTDNNTRLERNGRVVIFLGLEPREAMLHDNNDALFENTPMKYLNTPVKFGIHFTEDYVLKNPDSLYTLTGNRIIYLKATIALNNVVNGFVTYKNKPLKDVEVFIGEVRDTTDAKGFYKLTLDKANLNAEQTITFYKAKFKLNRKKIDLRSLDNLDIIMEK